jgi:hypothetical protein
VNLRIFESDWQIILEVGMGLFSIVPVYRDADQSVVSSRTVSPCGQIPSEIEISNGFKEFTARQKFLLFLGACRDSQQEWRPERSWAAPETPFYGPLTQKGRFIGICQSPVRTATKQL